MLLLSLNIVVERIKGVQLFALHHILNKFLQMLLQNKNVAESNAGEQQIEKAKQ